jgi:diguanylate cyclase (GGDEF)-like protein/PAS domain S-box-containing protein
MKRPVSGGDQSVTELADDVGIAGRVRLDQVKLLYGQGRGALFITACAATFLVIAVFEPSRQAAYLAWLGSMWGMLILRIVNWHGFYRSVPGNDREARHWSFRYCTGVVLTAAIWAAWPLIFFRQQNFVGRAIGTVVLAGMAGGGVAVLAMMRWLALTYGAALLAPASTLLLLGATRAEVILGILGFAYLGTMGTSVSATYRSIITALHLSQVNERLRREAEERRRDTEELNQQLVAAKLALTGANQQLEDKVSERTAALQREISERRQAQEALREREEYFRCLIEKALDVIAVIEPDGRIRFVSPSAKKVVDYDPHELIGKNGFDYIHPEDVDRTFSILLRLVSNPGTHEFAEFRFRHRDGSWRHLEGVGASLLDEPAVRGIVVNVRDITERKRAEAALYEEKERAQVTLHSIGDAVITTDAESRVEYLNPVAEALTGWPTQQARGKPLSRIFRIIDEDSRQPAPDPVSRCLKEGKIQGLANHSVLVDRHGREYAVEDTAAPILGRDGAALGVVLVFHDVTEARRLTRQMAHDAAYDALTGLINRREFESRLERVLASAKEYGGHHALCYIDLDQFKLINDTAGHAAGDRLLGQIKGLLSDTFRERDTLARLGGDEFGLLLDNCPLEHAVRIAREVIDNLRSHRFLWEDQAFQVGASIGLVPVTAESQSVAQLLSQADVACYTAKDLGRNRVHVYQQQDSEIGRWHGEILRAAKLRDTIDQERFCLYCQPVLPLASGVPAPKRYELLLRLLDEDGGLVPPEAFIPAAERYGLMEAIDRWVVRTAFRTYPDQFGPTGGQIAINLSGNSLNDESLLEVLREQFEAFAFPPDRICFEITETAAIRNLAKASEFMREMKRLGSELALDDFGSGLSSFRYLQTLPVDFLKIDGSFVEAIDNNANDAAIVAAINQLAHTLGIQTIAEYASSPAIVERLQALGVDYAQGYALGRPVPLAEMPQARRISH